jgi:hypothetical protein
MRTVARLLTAIAPRLAPVACVFSLLVAPCAAAGQQQHGGSLDVIGHPHLVAPARDAVSDGGDYVLLGSPEGIGPTVGTLVDSRSGSRKSVVAPCTYEMAGGAQTVGPSGALMGSPWLLLYCGLATSSTQELFDMASGHSEPLTVNSQVQSFEKNCAAAMSQNGPDHGLVCDLANEAVGADWVEFDEVPCNDCRITHVFQNISTGSVQEMPGWVAGATQIPDLSRSSLVRQVCAPLRVPGPAGANPGTLTLLGRFAIASGLYPSLTPQTTGYFVRRTYLEHCGSAQRIQIPNPPVGFPTIAASVHAVAWPRTARNGSDPEVRGILLPSLRRFVVHLPHRLVGLPYVTISDRTLYLPAYGTPSEAWAMKLPAQTSESRPRSKRR